MMIRASQACPWRALPVLVVALLLAAPRGAAASEGAADTTPRPLPMSAPSTHATMPSAAKPASPRAATKAAATPSPTSALQARGRPIPPPKPIPAGPVWTDSSGTWRQVGIASWYGGQRWHGRLTASGVRFNENHLTAAHASLPLGSQVRVTVADTGRTIIVTINDRPGTRKRIIDLSRAAAQELGILGRGVAKVSLTPG